MIPVYYAIKDAEGQIVEEDVVNNSEATIYPGQTTGIPELPFECELHHFKAEGYTIEVCSFTITRDIVKKYRTTGDKLVD